VLQRRQRAQRVRQRATDLIERQFTAAQQQARAHTHEAWHVSRGNVIEFTRVHMHARARAPHMVSRLPASQVTPKKVHKSVGVPAAAADHPLLVPQAEPSVAV
jgi:hypothetical protein